MNDIERAEWLAGMIPTYGDYEKEAAIVLRRLAAALDEARRENERLRKDAARYQWLRGCRDLGDHTGVWEQLCGTGFRMRLDAFIDAILVADGKEESHG